VTRVLVLGLDGVGFPVLQPWMEAGRLPHLALAMARSVHGDLESTIPPITGPAWTTFQTGVNPGKHGVLGWMKRHQESYALSVITGADNAYPTVWELASEAGRRIVSIGVPMTYPPRAVNGIIIPGMLTPSGDPAPTYPREAFAELKKAAPDYHFFPECAHRLTLKAKVAELVRDVRGRGQAAEHFMTHKDWDLFMLHFQATDKVQHDLWGLGADGTDPLLSVFEEVDRQIGRLTEIAREAGAHVILLSDHGMGRQDYLFSVNTWLLQTGYLKLKRTLPTRLRRLAFRMGLTQNRFVRLGFALYPLAYRLGLVHSFFDTVGQAGLAGLISRLFLSLDDIDWSRTKAYSYSDIGHIRLNRKAREPQGIVTDEQAPALVDALIAGLETVTNPRTKEPLLGQAFRREEIYTGKHVDEAPELLFLPRDLRTIAIGASGFYSSSLFSSPLLRANHRMKGMLIATGDAFRPAHQLTGARLVDLAANLLYLLGCPIPRYMDGAVWQDAYRPEWLSERPIRHSDRTPERGPSTKDETDDLSDELKQRLKQLGYLT
jgi:predicted AlkP superfamily phosphohydrolase/phosphomutase